MAGFCIELRRQPQSSGLRPLRLVSLGEGERLQGFVAGQTRALWSRWERSHQLWTRRDARGLWWIEGQPDRWPLAGESLPEWLSGRWGSFRGFVIDARTPKVTIFADPLATRPAFYLRTREAVYVSDKLATLAAASGAAAAPNWDALLEQLLTGVLLNRDTSLEGARQLEPGEVVELGASGETATIAGRMPEDPDLRPSEVAADPSGTLFGAVQRSVRDVWADQDVVLLLSGGLDSRLVLRLGGPGRKALTVTTRENRESRIARRIAEVCQAELTHICRPPDQYHRVVALADLLLAAMDQPIHAHFLGMLSQWRAAGVSGVIHAFLFDSFFKGCEVFALRNSPTVRSLQLPGSAPFDVPERFLHAKGDKRDEGRLVGALSAEGRERLVDRVAQLTALVPSRPVDGLETAIEQEFARRVGRSNSYGNLLCWMEEQDVCSVIFHPSIWSWMRASRPRARYSGRAFRGALRRAGLDLLLMPSANTGWPAAIPPSLLQPGLLLRDYWWYPAARALWRVFKPGAGSATRSTSSDELSWPPYAPIFRTGAGRELLERHLGELACSCLFDEAALHAIMAEFAAGDDTLIDTLLALSGTGAWAARVRELGSGRGGAWLRTAEQRRDASTEAVGAGALT